MKTFFLVLFCLTGIGFAVPEPVAAPVNELRGFVQEEENDPPRPEPVEPDPQPQPEPDPVPNGGDDDPAKLFFRVPEVVVAKQGDGFAFIVVETNLTDDPKTLEDDVIVKARKTLTERVNVFEIINPHPDGLLESKTRTWVISTAIPGDYLVEFNLPIRRAPECVVRVTGKQPEPKPDPKPDPDEEEDKPDPKPTADVGSVVVVEQMQTLNEATRNIRMSETWRRLSQTKEIVDRASWYDVDDPNAAEFVSEAKSVGLPAILLFDDSGDLIRAEKLPTIEADLMELVK